MSTLLPNQWLLMRSLTTTVAVYRRISKDPSGLEVGVNRPRQDCLALAKDFWPKGQVRLYIDNDVSAADPAVARPQWLAMLNALRCGEIDEVVAYDQSRLTRQPIEWEQCARHLRTTRDPVIAHRARG